MRRVTGNGGDVFSPKGQLKKELELANSATDQVLQILAERLSDERRLKIDQVVSHRKRRITVGIEGVIDPHNTAAVIRTAEAHGMQTIHVLEGDDQFLSSRRVTQGTHKWIDLAVWKSKATFVDTVHAEKKQILVADAAATVSLDDLSSDTPLALVFGNEHAGISPELREMADGAFAIPMVGFAESFNVSVAAAISISTACRHRKGDLTEAEQKVLRARFYLRAIRAGYDIVKREMTK